MQPDQYEVLLIKREREIDEKIAKSINGTETLVIIMHVRKPEFRN